MDLNRHSIIGNVTRDAELKQTKQGTDYVSFSVATNYSYKKEGGEKVEEVTFHNLVAWGSLAKIIAGMAKKGKKVYVEGRVKHSQMEHESGFKYYSHSIIVENFMMLSKKEGAGNGITDDDIDSMAGTSSHNQDYFKEEEIAIEDVPF